MLFRSLTQVFKSGTTALKGKLFSLKGLQAKTSRVKTDALNELIHVDDMNKNVSSKE